MVSWDKLVGILNKKRSKLSLFIKKFNLIEISFSDQKDEYQSTQFNTQTKST